MNSFSESASLHIKGDVWLKLGKGLTREQVLQQSDVKFENLIVDICSDLIAQWAFTGVISNVGDHIPGVLTLAVGTGAPGWDLQNPPVETANLTVLYTEIARKTFVSTNYVDNVGSPSPTRTNIVDFTTTFLEAEAVGPLVEMGLFGGVGATSTGGGTRVNAKHFPVINKPSTSQLTVVWRLTF